MILDANSLLSSSQLITATAVSTQVYDTAGVGYGNPVPSIFGTATVYGRDIGIGDGASPPNLLCVVATTFTAGGSATLQVELQAGVDNGSNAVTTWDTIATQLPAYPVALLIAGLKIAEFTVPPAYPGQGLPRFYRLNYIVASGPMTAGALTAALITGRDDQPAYPANF